MNESLIDPETKDPGQNYLQELVGEGKKFKDVESLAKGKFESDSYINLLTRQLDQMRSDYTQTKAELETRAKFEELLDKYNAKTASNDNPVNASNDRKPEIDPSEIRNLVSKEVLEIERTRKQDENYRMVKAKLAERFGNNLEQHLQNIGLSDESATQIARSNPQLLLKALGVDQPREQGFQPPPRNSSGFNPSPPQKRTWTYYQDLRKKDPKAFNDPKINVQMQKDYIALGAEFEDGDFKAFG